MTEPNPSPHVDGESSSFELLTDTSHVQRHQWNVTVREGQVTNEIPDIFGSTSRVINQTTNGATFQTPPRVVNQPPQEVPTPNHGAGPSAPSGQALLNFSALLGLPEGETLASWYAKQTVPLNLLYAQLSAQQDLLQAQANQSAFVTPPHKPPSTHIPQQTHARN
ncbi:hypothetical protein Hanom_Chr08g00743961 [Helianthus anomalus]